MSEYFGATGEAASRGQDEDAQWEAGVSRTRNTADGLTSALRRKERESQSGLAGWLPCEHAERGVVASQEEASPQTLAPPRLGLGLCSVGPVRGNAVLSSVRPGCGLSPHSPGRC